MVPSSSGKSLSTSLARGVDRGVAILRAERGNCEAEEGSEELFQRRGWNGPRGVRVELHSLRGSDENFGIFFVKGAAKYSGGWAEALGRCLVRTAFLATKVLFANELYDLCQKLEIPYDDVKIMVQADRRIGKSHFEIAPERGFGGKCFPKDLIALIGLYQELGVDASLLETVWKKNLAIRTVKDWEDIPFVKTG